MSEDSAGTATADRDALAVAVLAAHEALDAWAAAVRDAADAHPGDPDSATEAPELGAAEDAWDDAFDAFHEAAGRVLGFVDEDDGDALDGLERDPEDAVGVELYATVTGEGFGEPLLLVDAEGEKLITALEAAGFVVPEWGVRLVCVEDLSADESLVDGDEADHDA